MLPNPSWWPWRLCLLQSSPSLVAMTAIAMGHISATIPHLLQPSLSLTSKRTEAMTCPPNVATTLCACTMGDHGGPQVVIFAAMYKETQNPTPFY